MANQKDLATYVANLHWMLCHQTEPVLKQLINDTLVATFDTKKDIFLLCDLQDWFRQHHNLQNGFKSEFLLGCRV